MQGKRGDLNGILRHCWCDYRGGFDSVICLMSKVKEQNGIIIACVLLLYALNRFALKEVVSIPILSYLLKCHFNDYLGGIFIIAYINIILQHSRYKQYRIHTLLQAIVVTLLCSIVWEFVAPYFFHYGTSDLWDIAAYMIGGSTYIWIQQLLARRTAV